MSTRCHVVLCDKMGERIMFYRHCDGYPSGVKKTLDKFCEWKKEDKIREDAMQASGWLVLLGMQEYAGLDSLKSEDTLLNLGPTEGRGWKIGAYEPCSRYYQDAEYVHVIDMNKGKYRSVHIPNDICEWPHEFQSKMKQYVEEVYQEMCDNVPSKHQAQTSSRDEF